MAKNWYPVIDIFRLPKQLTETFGLLLLLRY